MSALPEAERRRLLALMGLTLYERRLSPAPPANVVLVRLDRPKQALTVEERRVLARLLKALEWEGPFRERAEAGERPLLELALGVAASGCAERSVEGDSVSVLAASAEARRALWRRLEPHLPLLRGRS
ncbi:MAG: hypothetical protein KatS3mg125_0779 [Lysobacterales bacterium]|jgi:hypothetical protein|nr:MAG: hypothetical protein KatS3mg125_0779 [Xanthomonadales bacterium]